MERKIYEKYKVKLQRVLLIDEAKVFQKIAVRNVNNAIETQKEVSKIINCEIFLRRIDMKIKSDDFKSIEFLENSTFNNKTRVRKYLDYNIKLSGGVYGGDYKDINRKACSKEVLKVLEEMGK